MKRQCTNIYKNARQHAGLTQELASGLLNIGTRTLATYETGQVIPAAEIVCSMCEVYQADWLAYQHLQSSNPLGQKYLPEIDFSDLPRKVLRFQKELTDANQVTDQMVEVACDGRVDRQEMPVWNRVRKEIGELVGAGLALMFTQRERQPGRAAG